ncbi:MAG TPA: class I SAM-dependent methyltransferase [Candidatus Angelobacter sp.]|nr:class I SAM-dependent methyltransferase [Candidatus Angelobacter sp.]
MIRLPDELNQTIETAFQRAHETPGFLADNELRFLGALAACIPAPGAIVEIGSFKGKSTVMLASVAARYGLGRVVAIDPHAGLSYLGPVPPGNEDPTFNEFLASLKSGGVEQNVEVCHAFSRDAAAEWNRPIRLLWIDGDHSYRGCKEDFDLFSPYLSEGAVIALHDSLNAFEGPIRVFVEEILRSDRFGPCGFVHSIAWGQYRPADGTHFREERKKLERRASRLLPFVAKDASLTGLRKIAFKLTRSRVPRKFISPAEVAKQLSTSGYAR